MDKIYWSQYIIHQPECSVRKFYKQTKKKPTTHKYINKRATPFYLNCSSKTWGDSVCGSGVLTTTIITITHTSSLPSSLTPPLPLLLAMHSASFTNLSVSDTFCCFPLLMYYLPMFAGHYIVCHVYSTWLALLWTLLAFFFHYLTLPHSKILHINGLFMLKNNIFPPIDPLMRGSAVIVAG